MSSSADLRIVVDENIPDAEVLFSTLGTVVLRPGREINATHLADADVLIVRSVTRVDATLLQDSPVRFVGTCTIGIDHLDTAWLNSQGIAWASAPGCNARSVVEYVLGVCARISPQWLNKRFGIVGCGNVGGRLIRQLMALGVCCRYVDPLLDLQANQDLQAVSFSSLDDLLEWADVICLHTPLTTEGAFATHALMSESRLKRLKSHQLLINAGRGEVIDAEGLLAMLQTSEAPRVALDVWPQEPLIPQCLLDRVSIATPHIAGYSLDGKWRGSRMILAVLCDYLQRPPPEYTERPPIDWQSRASMPIATGNRVQDELNTLILGAYDPLTDDERLRSALHNVSNEMERKAVFDALRKNYPPRREYASQRVELLSDTASASSFRDELRRVLGFT